MCGCLSCALTGNRTSDPLVCRPALKELNTLKPAPCLVPLPGWALGVYILRRQRPNLHLLTARGLELRASPLVTFQGVLTCLPSFSFLPGFPGGEG